jgi:hypothetical protein
MRYALHRLATVVFVVMFPVVAAAQEDKSSLQGTARDATGAPVADVVVTVTSADQQTVRVVGTDTYGRYVIEGLEKGGDYELRASHPQSKKIRTRIRMEEVQQMFDLRLQSKRGLRTAPLPR